MPRVPIRMRRLPAKGNTHPARPSYAGHVLMENRHGLLVDVVLNPATGTAERDAALAMAAALKPGSSLGADKAYDTFGFVTDLRERGIVPHVAQNLNRRGGSAIDRRTTRHCSYRVSQVIRKRIEEAFGWGKEIGGLRQTKLRGAGGVSGAPNIGRSTVPSKSKFSELPHHASARRTTRGWQAGGTRRRSAH
jgi:hypothetical protein